jgi:hypothetical protein
VIGILRLAVAKDGKTAQGSYDDKLQNRTTKFDVTKQ